MNNINFSFKNKYKDKTPEQIINLIKQFFKKQNLIIREHNIIQSQESKTWSCNISLYSADTKIHSSCGKGVNLPLALASGYAELYERFCNKNFLYLHPIVSDQLLNLNYKKFHCYIHPLEKIKTQLENKVLYSNYSKIFGNDENIEDFLDFFINNRIIEVPFKNCFNDSIEYHDPRLWQKIMGSSGMAAGGSLEEAKVQGIGEIFEHLVQQEFYKSPPKELYEITNLNKENKQIVYLVHCFL